MLFVIDEQPDVFADAVASDDNAQLLFMSVFGRDTSIQQLMARCQLPRAQGGIDKLSFRQEDSAGDALALLIGDPSRLDKFTGRLPKENLFGNLVHAWVFDPVILEPDRAGRSGWQIREQRAGQGRHEVDSDALWSLIKDVSPLPLLDHWRDSTLAWLHDRGGIRAARCLGRVGATKVVLPSAFERDVSEMVRTGALQLSDEVMVAERLAA